MKTAAAKTWTCVGCGEQNDPLDRACAKCGSDGRATIAGTFTQERTQESGIPTTQAEAATKEAATNKPRTVRVDIAKGTGFAAELRLQGGGDVWITSTEFLFKGAGINGTLPGTADCEERAVARGFEALREWFQELSSSSPTIAPKIRKARNEAAIHEQRLIGAWLKKQPTTPPLAERVNHAPLEQIELARVAPSPANFRKEYDEAALLELADSLAKHGLLQPISVYRVEEGSWELIAGERRYRAAKLAKLKAVPCRVIDCSAAEADELRLIENLKRKDLTAIEEALGYQDLIEKHGYTQQKLGEQIGLHQSTIANRIRLLRLPPDWQQKIIRREISESHARHLVDYAEYPKVMAHLAKALQEEIRANEEIPPLRDWADWLYNAAQEVGREIDPKARYSYQDKKRGYCYGDVLFTERDLETHGAELEIITLFSPYTKKPERFALNLKKWEELHTPLEKAKQERAAKGADRSTGSAKQSDRPEPTAAELRERKAQQAKQLAKRIEIYRNAWIQRQASAACQKLTHEQGIRLLIGFAGMPDTRGNRMTALMAAIKEVRGKAGSTRALPAAIALPDDRTLAVAKAALGRWLAQSVEDYGNALRAQDLPAIAELLDIKVERDWRLDETFLLLHTKEQLSALFTEWKLIGPLKEKRTDVIKELLACNTNNRVPAPKSLLKGVG